MFAYLWMRKIVEIAISPREAADPGVVKDRAIAEAGVDGKQIACKLVRRSIDARGRRVLVRMVVELIVDEPQDTESLLLSEMMGVQSPNTIAPKRVVIVGSGPAGYFAALELLFAGIQPVVLERGADVRTRRRHLRDIQQYHKVNPHSNYCFGEGGAGTYSDGKLYTRSHKRGSIKRVLQLLVEHGATDEILVDAHPHIGSNKLWAVVQSIRETIVNYGGEVRFDAYVNDFVMGDGGASISGVVLESGETVMADAVILATGHSARDIFHLCVRKNIQVEAKPFALGVRIEHPQELIDSIQYGIAVRDEFLPASSYSLVCQTTLKDEQRGVFSFCMCPGGLIVPAATSPGEIVVNGMSMSRRDSPFANSGTVTAVEPKDWKHLDASHGVLAAMEYQAQVERSAFEATGDGSQRAPAQRLVDFVQDRLSSTIPDTSYIPGHTSVLLSSVLPSNIYERLKMGVHQFGRQMAGYYTNEAVVVATESRTSSPVRIPRNPTTYEHTTVAGLYPCGEGAGYAGGIVSAALDGQNVARAVASKLSGF